jgi:MFS family permease
VPEAAKRLFRGTFLFGLACGISIALSALHLNARGFSKQDIGSLASVFGTGVVIMALPAGALIRRFSGKRTLLACLSLYSVCVAVFPFLQSYQTIAGVRLVDGMCSAGIWVSSETLVLMRAEKKHKAYLTSIYAIWLAVGYMGGPLLAQGINYAANMTVAFVIAGLLAVVAAVYLGVVLPLDPPESREHDGGEEATEERGEAKGPAITKNVLELFVRIKTSAFAAFAYGYFQASVVLFLPLYLIESKGIAEAKTIVLPGFFALGMLLCSNFMARIADRIGHLLMMRILSMVGVIDIFGFVFLDWYGFMCVGVFLAGATFATLSPISLALQGVVTAPKDYSRSNALYNAFYAAGMLAGPPISSTLFQKFGGRTMLFHLSALWSVFIILSLVFMFDDPAARKKRGEAAPATP